MEYISVAETISKVMSAAGDGMLVVLVAFVIWKAVGFLGRI